MDPRLRGRPELEGQGATRNVPRGRRLLEDAAAGVRVNWSARKSSMFPDAHFDVEGAVCDDDGYAIQSRWTGSHSPSGRSYDIRGA